MRTLVLFLICLLSVSCDSAQKGYAKFALPNGDSILIDRVEIFDPPIVQYRYRVVSKPHSPPKSENIFGSLQNERPVFGIIGPGSDSVVAIISTNAPASAIFLYDFRDGACFPYDYIPDDVAPRPDDPKFPALENKYQTKIRDLLNRLRKATGDTLDFHDGYSGRNIKA